MTVQLTAIVSGRVQGVGFRQWTRAKALDLGLGGSATNLPDDTVEVVAIGPREQCERLLEVLNGRTPGHVKTVTARWEDDPPLAPGFAIY